MALEACEHIGLKPDIRYHMVLEASGYIKMYTEHYKYYDSVVQKY